MIMKIILKAIKPFRLIALAATYSLGAGLVQYVRSLKSWSQLISGLVFLVCLSLSLELMRLLKRLASADQWPVGVTFKEVKQTRTIILALIATFLTAAAIIFVHWMISGVLWQGFVILVLSLLGLSFFYYLCEGFSSLKPYQLLFEGLFYIVVPPAFAYFLQSDETHLFLTLMVMGFVPAYLAFRILSQLQSVDEDDRLDHQTIVVRMGWEKALVFHNALVLLTFVIFALIVFFGFPWFLLWPVFLALPIGMLEVWLMERVRRGGKPFWVMMRVATASILFIPVYLLSFAFWIR